MPRVTSGPATRKRRAKVLKRAKGFRESKSKKFVIATIAVDKALTYAFRDRKAKKRQFRSLWNIRINAAVRELGLSYNRFINGLKKANVAIDRKILADIAIHDPFAFQEIVKIAQNALKKG